jgi:chemotaxis protein methyltransferase CheR
VKKDCDGFGGVRRTHPAATEETQQLRVLEQTHWKVSGKNGAAEILGLNRSTLRARMRKFDIRKP